MPSGFESWRAFYESDLQSFWLLVPVPVLFGTALLLTGRSRARGGPERFVHGYALVFTAQTLADLIANGPLARALSLSDRSTTLLMLTFVLLGDFRVFALVFGLLPRGPQGLRGALARAARWTLVVPIAAGVSFRVADAVAGGLPGQALWLLYEVAFLSVALLLRQRVIPRRAAGVRGRFLRTATGYVAAYYALWAGADALVLLLGWDPGWLLRVIPNQLYYALWTPFVYAGFRLVWRRKASTSSSAQASR